MATATTKATIAGDVPLRESIRSALDGWLEKLNCGGDVEKKLQYKQKFVKKLKEMPIAIKTVDANQQHYEVPTDFYLTVLGARSKFSSCYYPTGKESLDQAEDAMLDLVCQRSGLQDGDIVMDLGCGWGATGLWILEKYPNCKVTCVSNSRTQGAHIRETGRVRGYDDRLTVITADANEFDTGYRFDTIISIEMFEHMKNYEQLLKKVSSWLKPNGRLFTHILCHREYTYHFDSDRGSDTEWMAQHFFSGGTMPSSDLFLYFQNDLSIIGHWNVNGIHYSRTLEAWLELMDDNIEKCREIFAREYGPDEVEKQIANWRMFFIHCSEVFACHNGNEWIVAHHLFRKKLKSNL